MKASHPKFFIIIYILFKYHTETTVEANAINVDCFSENGVNGCKDPMSESILIPNYAIFNDLTTVSDAISTAGDNMVLIHKGITTYSGLVNNGDDIQTNIWADDVSCYKVSNFVELIKNVSSKSFYIIKSSKYMEMHMDNNLQFGDTNKHYEQRGSQRPTWPYLKWGETPPYLPRNQWREFLTCYNRKRVLRVAKVVLSRYITKSNNSKAYSKECLIPSYCIKTILFYMCSQYPDDSPWSDELLTTRLLELLSILKTCLDHNQLISYYSPRNILTHIQSDITYLYKQIQRNITTLVDELDFLLSETEHQLTFLLTTNETYTVICIVVLTINLNKAKLRIYAAMRRVAIVIDGVVTP